MIIYEASSVHLISGVKTPYTMWLMLKTSQLQEEPLSEYKWHNKAQGQPVKEHLLSESFVNQLGFNSNQKEIAEHYIVTGETITLNSIKAASRFGKDANHSVRNSRLMKVLRELQSLERRRLDALPSQLDCNHLVANDPLVIAAVNEATKRLASDNDSYLIDKVGYTFTVSIIANPRNMYANHK